MKLLGSIKSKITKDENGENLTHFEITEVLFVHCTIVNNDYLQGSRALYSFISNKPFGNKSKNLNGKYRQNVLINLSNLQQMRLTLICLGPLWFFEKCIFYREPWNPRFL